MTSAGELCHALELAGVEPDLVVGVAPGDPDAAERDRLHRPAAHRAGDRGGARAARGHHVADDVLGDVGGQQAQPALDLGGGELGARRTAGSARCRGAAGAAARRRSAGRPEGDRGRPRCPSIIADRRRTARHRGAAVRVRRVAAVARSPRSRRRRAVAFALAIARSVLLCRPCHCLACSSARSRSAARSPAVRRRSPPHPRCRRAPPASASHGTGRAGHRGGRRRPPSGS